MVENVMHITSEYEERLRRCQYVPRLSFGRQMLRNDGAPNRFFLLYLFCNESMAIQYVKDIGLIILTLDLVLFFFNNLSPLAPFHSFFVLIHSYYILHPYPKVRLGVVFF